MPKVSVIIPTYNCATYLPEAINSVLNQTYKDFEVIIIDDGSVDNTKEIVNGYSKKYSDKIRYFYQKNKGPGAARNKGMLEAIGDYISFLDADDVLLKNSLLRRVEFLDKYSDVGLVFTDYYKDKTLDGISVLKINKFLEVFNDSIDFKSEDKFIFNRKFYSKYLTFSPHPISTCTVMIKKEIVRNIGYFRTDIFIGEDLDFWMRIAKKYRVGFIDCPLTLWNSFIMNSLTKNKERYYLDSIKCYLSIYDGYQNKPIVRKRISEAYFSLGYYYFALYNLKDAKKYFLLSIKYNLFKLDSFIYLIFSLLPIQEIRCLREIKSKCMHYK